ncbi:RNA polymerase II [Cichlidogyrus casuarinus]|uniref:RNA polymerase II n=1 Tax=Cichlidogyrus casuarinus TaxID=1844966 RepID=A0ABD2Q4U8_9PLAT
MCVSSCRFFMDSGDINAPVTHSTTFQPRCLNSFPSSLNTSLEDGDQKEPAVVKEEEESTVNKEEEVACTSQKNEQKLETGESNESKLISEAIARIESEEESLDRQDANYLLALEKVLTDFHSIFYASYDENLSKAISQREIESMDDEQRFDTRYVPNLADVMTERRRSILGSKCRITLSGLSHLNSAPAQSLSGELAAQMGAELHSTLRINSTRRIWWPADEIQKR